MDEKDREFFKDLVQSWTKNSTLSKRRIFFLQRIADDIRDWIEFVCSSTDECKITCCQLNKIYSTAKNSCTTDIDKQLSDVNWKIPFSAHHKQSCESVCSKKIVMNENFTNFINSVSNYSCDNFLEVCYSFSSSNFFKFWSYEGEYVILCASLAIILLTFTLILYLAVPELHRKLNDKCFVIYLSCRIVNFAQYFVEFFVDIDEPFTCNFFAFIWQFSGLASEFWLSVICFHLWRCIKSVIPPFHSPTKTMFHYSLYAWGCPLFFTALTHVIDSLLPEKSRFRPGIGKRDCNIRYFDDRIIEPQLKWLQPMFIYFYSITVMIQIISFSAFVHIVLIMSSKEKIFKRKGNENQLRRHRDQRSEILVYLKLFLLMGLTRIVNVSLILLYFERPQMEIINVQSMGAFFIFIIFACNKRAFNLAIGRNKFFQTAYRPTVPMVMTPIRRNNVLRFS